jgi:hypothetical protein
MGALPAATAAAHSHGPDGCDVPLAEAVCIDERASNPAQKYGIPGSNVFLPAGAIVGPRDFQMGSWVPGVPSMLDGDIGAGNYEHPGILRVGADVTRCSVYHAKRPGEPPVRMMQICPTGITVYVVPRLAGKGRLALASKVKRLERRIARLERLIRGR